MCFVSSRSLNSAGFGFVDVWHPPDASRLKPPTTRVATVDTVTTRFSARLVFGSIDALERTCENASGIRGQSLDCVAVIEDDVIDFQLARRLSSKRLFVGDVPRAVRVVLGLAVQLLRHYLPSEIDRGRAVPKTYSAGRARA